VEEKGRKQVHWSNEIKDKEKKEEVYEKELFGSFEEDDSHFCGEIGNWVTERIGSPKWRAVAPHELWRWRKERLESMVLEAQEKSTGAKQKDGTIGGWRDLRVKRERDCEKGEYRWRDMGPAEIMLRYLKERTANDIFPQPTVYALCQAYYERTEGRMHCKVPGICLIMSCVLCYSEKLDLEQDTVAKGQAGEEGKEEIAEDWGAMVEILESSEITIGKPAWGEEEEIRSREGQDQLDEVFGQTGG